MPRKILTAYRGLKPIHRQYVDLVMEGNTGTAAVRKIRPGYKRPELLSTAIKQRLDVQAAFKERQRIEEADTIARVRRMDHVIDVCANYDIADYYIDTPLGPEAKPLKDIPEEARLAICGITYDKSGRAIYKLADRDANNAMIGKRTGAFIEKLEVSGEVSVDAPALTDHAIATRLAFLLMSGIREKLVSTSQPGAAALLTSTKET